MHILAYEVQERKTQHKTQLTLEKGEGTALVSLVCLNLHSPKQGSCFLQRKFVSDAVLLAGSQVYRAACAYAGVKEKWVPDFHSLWLRTVAMSRQREALSWFIKVLWEN